MDLIVFVIFNVICFYIFLRLFSTGIYLESQETPSKVLIKGYIEAHKGPIKDKCTIVAHGWAYDSTLQTLEDLVQLYGLSSEKEAKDLLIKFVRKSRRI